ncbi:hypothetical protein F6V30_12830 [Oryzomonas sagensis]|uniref:Uncharacterized protein n=1 Tax=Oryzomonas sagensis TaxID=2603857 RepID=A0ABQ6TN92_9BACT|nr:hypothetical protein [Oryzomonas sagensis]KAB0669680.1 hypothetical protein F6V30_12830 [Oryzomonas sagensis]
MATLQSTKPPSGTRSAGGGRMAANGSSAGVCPPKVEPLGAAAALGYLSVDINQLLFDVSTTFNPLHQGNLFDCQAAGVRDGRYLFNVALPYDLARFFVTLMESMTSVFVLMSRKAVSSAAHLKTIDPAAIAEREQAKADFSKEVCSIYDSLIDQGFTSAEAVKRTNFALKSVSHPWATHDLVKRTLRAEGRFRAKNRHSNRKE